MKNETVDKKEYLKNNLENIFEKEIMGSSIIDLFADSQELVIDSLLEDGLAKDIPIVGTVIKLSRIAFTVKDRFTAKKILKFIFSIKNTTEDQRKNFLIKLEENESYGQEATSVLLMSLDRFDSIYKATLYGKLLIEVVNNNITIDEFKRYSYIIEKIFLNDLFHLKEFEKDKSKEYDITIAESLSQFGLLKVASFGGLTWEGGIENNSEKYALTNLGSKLLELDVIN
ncbi:MAG: hypothetical protein ACE364_01080 [Chlorobiota bacterium]